MRKQPFLYFFLLSSIIVTILVTACNDHSAENKANDGTASEQIAQDSLPPMPGMWISKTISKEREANYDTIRQVLKDSCGIEETQYLFYEVKAFEKMIDHFRSLKYEWLDIIIADSNHKLTLLYQPISDTGRMGYYTLPDNATDFNQNDPLYSLDPDTAEKMIDAYSKGCKMRILKQILDKKDSLNYVGGTIRKDLFYNTLSILHDSISIGEIMTEIQYQGTLNNRVSGVRAIFAMIGSKGLESEPYLGRYKNRLNMHFDFTKRNENGVNEVFYIDNPNRTLAFVDHPTSVKDKHEKYILPATGLDKGQLCPAHCPEVGDGK